MRAAEILELDALSFVEPGFASLTEDAYTTVLLGIPATEARLLVDMAEEPLAVAVSDGKDWYAVSFLFRKPPGEIFALCERLDAGIYQEERSAWTAAIREYYSLLLVGSTTPALEDLPPDRLPALIALLEEIWGRSKTVPCIDCCCGSGAGSAAARALGMQPLSYDNDPALLSLGLSASRLRPEETMWIDAAAASRYLEPVPKGIAVMMGEINPFTLEIWEDIAAELLSLVEEAIITVGTEPEARRVEGWCLAAGHRANVSENPRHTFYDRWVCRSEKEG